MQHSWVTHYWSSVEVSPHSLSVSFQPNLPLCLKEAAPVPSASYSRKLSNSVINNVIIDLLRLEPWRRRGRTALWVNPANSSETHVRILMRSWWFDRLGYWRQCSAASHQPQPWASSFGPMVEQLPVTGLTHRGWKSMPRLKRFWKQGLREKAGVEIKDIALACEWNATERTDAVELRK